MSTYLGQNFLTDVAIQRRIATLADRYATETGSRARCEIGPGKGAITRWLTAYDRPYLALEKDDTLLPLLTDKGRGDHVELGDALEIPFVTITDRLGITSMAEVFVVGNLPYYITSPLLRRFAPMQGATPAGLVAMIQKDVADKIRYDVDKKSFLRRLLNYAHQVRYEFFVPARAFRPAPRVDSAIISIIPRDDVPAIDTHSLLCLLDLVGPYSRKTLGKIAKLISKRVGYEQLIVPEKLRPLRMEQLSWQQLESIQIVDADG